MITFGNHCTMGIRTEGKPDVTIGNYTRIANSTLFWGHVNYPSVNNPNVVSNYAFSEHEGWSTFPDMGDKGPITVGNDVWIGDYCHILSGVTIGDGAIVGLGTIVSKDVPSYGVAVGSPMVIKRLRFSPRIIAELEEIKWWNWPHDLIRERIGDFVDIDKFIEKYANNS